MPFPVDNFIYSLVHTVCDRDVINLTDLLKNEVIKDGKGNHFRFVGTCNDLKEAESLCQQLQDSGYISAYNQRSDNQLYEVMTKFSPAEELQFLLEQLHCQQCPADAKAACSEKTCTIKKKLEENLFRERMGFVNLIKHDLKKLRAANASIATQ